MKSSDRDERLGAIAREYAKQPEGTLVVSPDNQSRCEINRGDPSGDADARAGGPQTSTKCECSIARQEITGADRQWAAQYEPGDVVRYTQGSKTHGIEAGEYARVERVNAKENLLTVKRENGEQVTYDPRRLQGVTLYRETERAFSQGDRVQFTAPNREQHVANRELGTIEKIDDERQPATASGLGPGRRVQPQRASASRLRLCRDEPQQPGTDRRPRARARGHGAGGRNSSIAGWRMWRCRAAATTRRSIRTTKANLSEQLSAATCRTDPRWSKLATPESPLRRSNHPRLCDKGQSKPSCRDSALGASGR